MSGKFSFALLFAVFGISAPMNTVQAQDSVEEFYNGRQMEMIIGYSPGGAYDHYARLVARHLPRFIPGNPEIIPRNMPGGGSRTAASYLFQVAPTDGSVIGTFDQGMPLEQVLQITPTDIDTSRLAYIGTPAASNNVTAVWHTVGVTSIEQARERVVTLGSTGSGGAVLYPRVMNAGLGTIFDIVAGYPGGNEINLAMENGEVDGRASNAWEAYVSQYPHFVENDLIVPLVQFGLRSEPGLEDVPLLVDLADDEAEAALFALLSAPVELGRPIVTTPDVPEERLQALRDAFDAMVADEEFLAAAAAEGLDINPRSGEEMQVVVEEILNADLQAVETLRAIATAN